MMRSVNVMSFLLFYHVSLSVGKGEVYFISKNFFNVLHWDPVTPAFPGQKVLYSVQYCNDYDQQYQIKKDCQNMTDLSCDLTAETPSLHDVHYFAKVCVNNTFCVFSTRFKPLRDTILGQPILWTHTTASTVHVKVSLPHGPNGVSVADIITNSKETFSRTVPLYIFKITDPEWAEEVYESTASYFDIKMRYNQTEYCGYVVYKPQSEWGCSDSENASFCFKLTDDPPLNLKWSLASVAVLAGVLIISVVCVYSYVKNGKIKQPNALVVTSSNPNKRMLYQDGKVPISKVFLSSPSELIIRTAIQENPKVWSPVSGGYSPQNISQENADHSKNMDARSTIPDQASTSDQSSELYSEVVVQVVPDEDEDFPQKVFLSSRGERWESDRMISKLRETPLSDSDSGENYPTERLLLKTVRNVDGQLVLPFFTFQLDSTTGDAVSPVSPERKPLLSDLINCQEGPSLASLQSYNSSDWTDSGCDDSFVTTPTNLYCNQHYHHSQQVDPDFHQGCQAEPSCDVIFDSSFKANSLSEILHGPTFILGP